MSYGVKVFFIKLNENICHICHITKYSIYLGIVFPTSIFVVTHKTDRIDS